MKKVNLIFASAVFALTVGLSGCAKEDPAKPLEINKNQTATFTGKVLYINNTALTPQTWAAPALTSSDFMVTIDYKELNPLASGTYVVGNENVKYSNGVFTFDAPVALAGTTVTVVISNKGGTRTYKDNSDIVEKNGIWEFSNKSYSAKAYPGQTVDLGTNTFTSGNFSESISAGDPSN